MTCPVCGGETVIIDTRANIDHIIRRRRCEECDYIFRTIEMEMDLYEKTIEGERTHVDD